MDRNGRLMVGAPPGSIAIPHESGWMNGDIFLEWLQHFRQHVRPTVDDPVLLILDGHASHKELSVIMYARENNIHMLTTPPHTTHKLQPLDRTFFKPFRAGFSSASAAWMRRNPGARITDYDIAGLVDFAFTKAARLEIAQNGFKCAGIYPFDRKIFTDLDYLPSMMTEMEQDRWNHLSTNQDPLPSTSTDLHPLISRDPQPSTSRDSLPSMSRNTSALLKQLSPFPDASKKRFTTRSRKSQKSEILTSSPYKNELEKKKKSSKGKSLNTKQNIQSLALTARDQETECIICGETFQEDWIQCHKCKDWAHEACVDIGLSNLYYYCDVCQAKTRLGHL